MSGDEITGRELRDRLAVQLRAIANVNGVALGGRIRHGEPTGEPCLTVLVDRKVPTERLSAEQLVPEDIVGLRVDVVALPRPRPLTLPARSIVGAAGIDDEIGWVPYADDAQYPFLRGGIQLMSELAGTNAGTLGCLLRDAQDAGAAYALTAYHVVAGHEPPDSATRVGHPTAHTSISRCCTHQFGTFAGGIAPVGGGSEYFDVAVCRLDPGTLWAPLIAELGVVRGTADVTWNDVQGGEYQVAKRGITSRSTGGTVLAVGAIAAGPTDGTSPEVPANALIVRPNASPIEPTAELYFALDGDSGSVVINDDNEVVALLWGGSIDPGDPGAGDEIPPELGAGFATPIGTVLEGLRQQTGLDLEVAVQPVGTELEIITVPGAAAARRVTASSQPMAVVRPVEQQLGRDLAATEAGRTLVDFWLRHQHELLQLVNHNKRVAAAWHRTGAARLFQLAMRAAGKADERFPTSIDGRTLDAVVGDFAAVLGRHASDSLRNSLSDVVIVVSSVAGRTYREAIESLKVAS